MIAIKLARHAYAAAAVPIGTVRRFDWTYRSWRSVGGGPSTIRMGSPPRSISAAGATKTIAVVTTSSLVTTPSRRVESDVRVSTGSLVGEARSAAAKPAGGPDAITNAPRRSPTAELDTRSTVTSEALDPSTADASVSAAAESSSADAWSPSDTSPRSTGTTPAGMRWPDGNDRSRSSSDGPVATMRPAPPSCASERKPGVASSSSSDAPSIVAISASRSSDACARAWGTDSTTMTTANRSEHAIERERLIPLLTGA